MSKKRKPKMEFRVYQTAPDSSILALTGREWRKAYGEDIDYLHFHNYLEIGYCYEGSGTLVLGEREFQYSGNQFSVIPKNYPHTTNSTPGTLSYWEYLFVDVEGFLEEVYARHNKNKAQRFLHRIESRAVLKSSEEFPAIAAIIRMILKVMREKKELYMEEAEGLLLTLLVNIVRENMGVEQDFRERDSKTTLPITRALDYISLYYMEPLKIEALADYCHISETHLRRIFAEYMKMSPLEYINLVRIQNACEHLKRTDNPISDIASKCGFSTVSTFNRNFKKITGVAPYEWRKRPQNYEQQLLNFEIHLEKGW